MEEIVARSFRNDFPLDNNDRCWTVSVIKLVITDKQYSVKCRDGE